MSAAAKYILHVSEGQQCKGALDGSQLLMAHALPQSFWACDMWQQRGGLPLKAAHHPNTAESVARRKGAGLPGLGQVPASGKQQRARTSLDRRKNTRHTAVSKAVAGHIIFIDYLFQAVYSSPTCI